MSLSYTLREGISGFTRARISSIISVITISISLLFLGLFTVASVHTSRFIDVLRNMVELEAFLNEPLSRQELEELRKKVDATEGVESSLYISKDDAAKRFQEEFGENINDILDFNPLPASFRITLKDGYKTSDKALRVSSRLEGIKGVESVRYRKDLLEVIDNRASTLSNLTLGLGLLISISAIFLVSNTIRLAIYAKRELIRTMQLVGATRTFIRLPFLLEGIIQGTLGALVAGAILYSLLEYALRLISADLTDVIHREVWFYAGLLGAGCFLGLAGGIISVARFIRTSTAS